jgi:TRAP-type C4-dicarboxylate transport system substrate-binding protein
VLELEYFKFKEVVKYIMEPPFLTPAMHLIINLEDWNALGPDLQRKIQDHVDAHKFKEITMEAVKYDEIALKKAAEYGVKTVTLPPAEVDKMKAKVKKFWDEVAGMSPYSKKMVETYREWLKYKGLDW